jgi:hypothetical protein
VNVHSFTLSYTPKSMRCDSWASLLARTLASPRLGLQHVDLVGTTSSISFKQPATFGRWHHSPPYDIFCAFLWGLHPNVTFPCDSQMGVPKLGLLLFQNFGHSYLSQIKLFLKMWRKYLIAFKKIFSTTYITLQLDFIWLLSKDLWSWVKFLIWFLSLILIITRVNKV